MAARPVNPKPGWNRTAGDSSNGGWDYYYDNTMFGSVQTNTLEGTPGSFWKIPKNEAYGITAFESNYEEYPTAATAEREAKTACEAHIRNELNHFGREQKADR
ncbi:MAG: hypothetical protein ABI876_04500 [Bacteroidota bacterium]